MVPLFHERSDTVRRFVQSQGEIQSLEPDFNLSMLVF
jgi:hypothetical protein